MPLCPFNSSQNENEARQRQRERETIEKKINVTNANATRIVGLKELCELIVRHWSVDKPFASFFFLSLKQFFACVCVYVRCALSYLNKALNLWSCRILLMHSYENVWQSRAFFFHKSVSFFDHFWLSIKSMVEKFILSFYCQRKCANDIQSETKAM